MNPQPTRSGNIARLVIYETLPFICLAMLWTVAAANALESKVRRELEPHADDPAYFTRTKIQLISTKGSKPTDAVADSDDDQD
jgi:hypothetical protein